VTEWMPATAPASHCEVLVVYLVWSIGAYETDLEAVYLTQEAADEHAKRDSDMCVEARPVLASPLPKARLL